MSRSFTAFQDLTWIGDGNNHSLPPRGRKDMTKPSSIIQHLKSGKAGRRQVFQHVIMDIIWTSRCAGTPGENNRELNQYKRPVIGRAVHLMERERNSLSMGFNLQKGWCTVSITRAKSKRASKGITDVLITTSNGSGSNQDRRKRMMNISASHFA